jgi:hypothetical protein
MLLPVSDLGLYAHSVGSVIGSIYAVVNGLANGSLNR